LKSRSTSEPLPHGEWLPWCKANIYRGVRDIQKLIKMASDPDPEAALEQERAVAREGIAKRRANAPNVRRIAPGPSDDADAVDTLFDAFLALDPEQRGRFYALIIGAFMPRTPHAAVALDDRKGVLPDCEVLTVKRKLLESN
jgi:hypothetical protein